jgi:hypothetical protein
MGNQSIILRNKSKKHNTLYEGRMYIRTILLLFLIFNHNTFLMSQQPPSYWSLAPQEQTIVNRLLGDLASGPPVIPDLWLSGSPEIIPELQSIFGCDYESAKISSINVYSITLKYYVNLNSIQYADYELGGVINYYNQWIAYYDGIINDPNSTSSIISQALMSRSLIASLKNMWPTGTYMY